MGKILSVLCLVLLVFVVMADSASARLFGRGRMQVCNMQQVQAPQPVVATPENLKQVSCDRLLSPAIAQAPEPVMVAGRESGVSIAALVAANAATPSTSVVDVAGLAANR